MHKADYTPSGGFGTAVASHAVPYSHTVPGQWFSGDGEAFCRIGPNETGWTSDTCWTGVHLHYGANGTKLSDFTGGWYQVYAGWDRHWQWTVG